MSDELSECGAGADSSASGHRVVTRAAAAAQQELEAAPAQMPSEQEAAGKAGPYVPCGLLSLCLEALLNSKVLRLRQKDTAVLHLHAGTIPLPSAGTKILNAILRYTGQPPWASASEWIQRRSQACRC